MNDKEFLNWCADRFELVYHVNENTDFVLKLRAIANALPADQATPNIATWQELVKVRS